ncbi:type II toxin-antitoxin system PrlF family antitoxin [Rhodoferax saidenbachensis]|uniref:Regulator n=1 Tax=Rhodoferax saidenbachensis TaxID=1484693 RepID=A0A1P8K9T1_9BURK|nr:type II toxin-antitoxin system PrlF family antitoxin [Rhodoferax saidenbachensis]APW42746.1 regulator [Rhodoferax saidenbachensis]
MEVESTLTERYQTTVPETVRRALRLGKRDKIHYSIRPSGEVVLTRASNSDAADPALGAFLGFLAQDIAQHPERLQAVDASLVKRVQKLTASVELDLNAALSADDE